MDAKKKKQIDELCQSIGYLQSKIWDTIREIECKAEMNLDFDLNEEFTCTSDTLSDYGEPTNEAGWLYCEEDEMYYQIGKNNEGKEYLKAAYKSITGGIEMDGDEPHWCNVEDSAFDEKELEIFLDSMVKLFKRDRDELRKMIC